MNFCKGNILKESFSTSGSIFAIFFYSVIQCTVYSVQYTVYINIITLNINKCKKKNLNNINLFCSCLQSGNTTYQRLKKNFRKALLILWCYIKKFFAFVYVSHQFVQYFNILNMFVISVNIQYSECNVGTFYINVILCRVVLCL